VLAMCVCARDYSLLPTFLRASFSDVYFYVRCSFVFLLAMFISELQHVFVLAMFISELQHVVIREPQ
jgi:hypothetical protein